MSYILDALRKAEHERHLGRPPSLTASPAPVQTTGQRLWLWLAVGLGLGFNAALLAYFLMRPQPAAEPVTPAAITPEPTPSESSAPASTSKPVTEPAGLASPAAAPVPAPTQPNSDPPASTPPKIPLTVASPPAPTAQPAAPRKNPTAANPPEAARPTAAPARERRQAAAPKPAPGPTVTIGPEPPPLLDTLPAEGRRGLPDLNLDIHVYSPDRDKRFVVINGRRYREGDLIEKGAVLESVTPNGAVLRQGGQRFRLSVRR